MHYATRCGLSVNCSIKRMWMNIAIFSSALLFVVSFEWLQSYSDVKWCWSSDVCWCNGVNCSSSSSSSILPKESIYFISIKIIRRLVERLPQIESSVSATTSVSTPYLTFLCICVCLSQSICLRCFLCVYFSVCLFIPPLLSILYSHNHFCLSILPAFDFYLWICLFIIYMHYIYACMSYSVWVLVLRFGIWLYTVVFVRFNVCLSFLLSLVTSVLSVPMPMPMSGSACVCPCLGLDGWLLLAKMH